MVAAYVAVVAKRMVVVRSLFGVLEIETFLACLRSAIVEITTKKVQNKKAIISFVFNYCCC